MNADVLVVGAGPAGLAAAIELRRLGAGRVLVVDRERAPGGVPRHCAHTGYGVRDLHRVLTGPAYARLYVAAAREAGVDVQAGTTVTALDGPRATLTSQDGIRHVAARAVLLATGCRERPRTARLVAGDRPAGVMTTGELQQRVYLAGQRLGGRALVVGAEHVSFSAMLTLAHAGARVLALVTDRPSHQSYSAFRAAAALRWRLPVWTSTAVGRIIGRDRIAAVELRDLVTGHVRQVDCETVVFSGDWIPDHELARLAGASMDPGTRGPAVDNALLTSVPGLFAAGNLVHAGEAADIAALSGRHAAKHIAAHLRDGTPDAAVGERVPILVTDPLAWIAPNAIGTDRAMPPRGHFLFRCETGGRAELLVRQGDRVLGRYTARLPRGGSGRLPAGWLACVNPSGGPVIITAR
jgi:thioredoxin reductase